MSIQWLFELQEFGKLFCFSDHRQLIPLICNPTSHNQLSRWVQFTCTLKYHLRWTPRRLAWRILTLCCEWKHEREHIFQYSESSNVPLTQNSMRSKLFESWEICTFLFWLWSQTVYIGRPTHPIWLQTVGREASKSPKYLLAVRVVTSNMGMHIGQILSRMCNAWRLFDVLLLKVYIVKKLFLMSYVYKLNDYSSVEYLASNVWVWSWFPYFVLPFFGTRAYLRKAANATNPQDPPTFRSANFVNDPSLQSRERSEARYTIKVEVC